MTRFLVVLSALAIAGCSVVGASDVKNAPFTLLKSDVDKSIEVRRYSSMVLVSTSMANDGRNNAFRRLFNYISGENEGTAKISMTAPVFMQEQSEALDGEKIAMTAPVFMSDSKGEAVMSFVMPAEFTLQTTPIPTHPDVWISQVDDYQVAAIKFSGTLSNSNVQNQTKILETWITENDYQVVGQPVKAGYNGPLTLPFLRHNEVLIEVTDTG